MSSPRFALAALSFLLTVLLFAAPPARAGVENCTAISQDAVWTDCLRREVPSADARLNLVYRRLVAALVAKPEALNRLREAERGWLAFRDAQCKLEAVATPKASGCVDRLSAARAEELVALYLCRAAGCAPAAPLAAAPLGVPFASADLLDGYRVSGIWFPEQEGPTPEDLRGPAIFLFAKGGETFGAAINGATLLDEEFWKRRGAIPDDLGTTGQIEMLRTSGPISISLAPESRAQISFCGTDVPYFDQGDKCLDLGEAPVDLIDLDFSGRKYFVFKQGGQAQRGLPAYEAMRLPFDKGQSGPDLPAPLGDLDGLMTFDLTQHRVVERASNGACSSGGLIYEKTDTGLRVVGQRIFVTDSNGTCRIETYTAKPAENGKGYELKLQSSEAAH